MICRANSFVLQLLFAEQQAQQRESAAKRKQAELESEIERERHKRQTEVMKAEQERALRMSMLQGMALGASGAGCFGFPSLSGFGTRS